MRAKRSHLPLNKILRALRGFSGNLHTNIARRRKLKARYTFPFRAMAVTRSRALPLFFLLLAFFAVLW